MKCAFKIIFSNPTSYFPDSSVDLLANAQDLTLSVVKYIFLYFLKFNYFSKFKPRKSYSKMCIYVCGCVLFF